MIYIAHRGNINGPSDQENTYEQARRAIRLGFHVELDVRLQDGVYWLGHDKAQEQIGIEYLADSRIWCHAKTVETFLDLSRHSAIQTFYQEGDAIALTSNGYLWCHSDHPMPGSRSILTILKGPISYNSYAVCTDYCPRLNAQPDPPIRLVILDVDGVMTTGQKTYDWSGRVISKTFYDKDFTAIKRLTQVGVTVVMLSSDSFNESIAKVRGIPFRNTMYQEKKMILPSLLHTYDAGYEETAFVGDDYYDLMLLEELDHSYCPSNAVPEVQRAVTKVLPARGGEGVVVALYEELASLLPCVYPHDSAEVNP